MKRILRPARLPDAVDRELLHVELGLPDKLPAGLSGTFCNVRLFKRAYAHWDSASGYRRLRAIRQHLVRTEANFLGVFDVVIKPTPDRGVNRHGRRIKSSAHRIFVRCDCGRLVPAGRMHQHRCAPDWNTRTHRSN